MELIEQFISMHFINDFIFKTGYLYYPQLLWDEPTSRFVVDLCMLFVICICFICNMIMLLLSTRDYQAIYILYDNTNRSAY